MPLKTNATFFAFMASALDLRSRSAFSSMEIVHGSISNSERQLTFECTSVGTSVTALSRATRLAFAMATALRAASATPCFVIFCVAANPQVPSTSVRTPQPNVSVSTTFWICCSRVKTKFCWKRLMRASAYDAPAILAALIASSRRSRTTGSISGSAGDGSYGGRKSPCADRGIADPTSVAAARPPTFLTKSRLSVTSTPCVGWGGECTARGGGALLQLNTACQSFGALLPASAVGWDTRPLARTLLALFALVAPLRRPPTQSTRVPGRRRGRAQGCVPSGRVLVPSRHYLRPSGTASVAHRRRVSHIHPHGATCLFADRTTFLPYMTRLLALCVCLMPTALIAQAAPRPVFSGVQGAFFAASVADL